MASTLKFVHLVRGEMKNAKPVQMHRHGDRSPDHVLPNDEEHNGEAMWPNGFGAL